jgi:hypothetical protein
LTKEHNYQQFHELELTGTKPAEHVVLKMAAPMSSMYMACHATAVRDVDKLDYKALKMLNSSVKSSNLTIFRLPR